MLLCALCVVPIFFAQYVSGLWAAVAIISLAAAAHQGWSANLFTLVSDMFPRKAVGSVYGVGGTAGAIGGMLFSIFIGEVLEKSGAYTLIFLVSGSLYLVALLIIQLLSPRLEQAVVAEA
jgi:ACS family hexuronate transporter-like MFS transporter